MNNRLERLRSVLRERELGALLVTSAANRRYLSGFSGSAGALLITPWEAVIMTDFRYRLQAARQAPNWLLREISAEQPLHKLAASVAAELGLAGLALEAEHASLSFSDKLSEALRERLGTVELKTTEGLIEGLREVKDEDEVAALRRAIVITDDALAAVLPQLRPEHSEKQAAWMIEVALREHGAEAISFPVIVAAGPNAALPHAQPGDDSLGEGRPIVIDMGARLGGYHADLTRTVVLGEPDAQFRNVYATVLAAQQRALDGIRPGMSGAEADALARDHITSAGYPDAFGHGLGHGVGLNIHEAPALRRASTHTLRAGNLFSVEPGIYLPHWGGVRIEDLVLLHPDGPEVLSGAAKLM